MKTIQLPVGVGGESVSDEQKPEVVEKIVYITKQHRGFAAMPKKKRLELCAKGGRAAHKKGVAYQWTRDQAREIGRKGGLAAQEKKRRLREERRLAELAKRQSQDNAAD